MAELTDTEIDAADERGRMEFETKPHAERARFDRRTGLMTLELYNQCSFAFPPRLLQGLEHATDEQLDAFELSFAGYGLHWDALDVDVSVPGLLAGYFGTPRYMETSRARLRQIYKRLITRPDIDLDAQAAE